MSDFDDFAASLLDEAKSFLEKATEIGDDPTRTAFLHAALLLTYCSLEAHVNSISEDFASRTELSPHTKGVLLEQKVRLVDGEFKISGFRMHRLEDRILFLYRQFSGKPLDKTQPWWAQLKNAINIRNSLTHPKKISPLSISQVREAILAVTSTMDSMYRAIYKRPFPAATLGLHSRLSI